MAYRHRAFDAVGGLDPVSRPVTWSDIDLCLRVREAGYRVVLACNALLMHGEFGTWTPDEAAEKLGQLTRTCVSIGARHRRAMRSDPFLNPHLPVGSGGRLLDPLPSERLWRSLRRGGV